MRKMTYDELVQRVNVLEQEARLRREAEEALYESQAHIQALMDFTPAVIYIKDLEGHYLVVNRLFLAAAQADYSEIIGRKDSEIFNSEFSAMVRELDLQAIKSGTPVQGEVQLVVDGRKRIYLDTKFLLNNKKDEAYAVCGIASDITEIKLVEGQLRNSLREKEVLLTEIHHRVKNNLQIVNSLLFLQSQRICNQEALSVIQDSMNRVKSMALTHEILYQRDDLGCVDFGDYISSLTRHLSKSFLGDGYRVKFIVDAANVFLALDNAIPCGLIINELVTNSLKHAFRGDEDGVIKVSLHRCDDKSFKLLVEDNGRGLPDGFDISAAETLGINLVKNLASQLQASYEFTGNQGVRCSFVFGDRSD